MSPPELHKQKISYFIEVVNLCDGCSNVQGRRGEIIATDTAFVLMSS